MQEGPVPKLNLDNSVGIITWNYFKVTIIFLLNICNVTGQNQVLVTSGHLPQIKFEVILLEKFIFYAI